MNGCLFIVATPIGNLEDITLRAIRMLREATIIACEDTRHSRVLLEHLGIRTRTISYHEHNEEDRTATLMEMLERGERVALISDAGTPLLSDPGFRIARAAIEAGISVEVAPGASALLTAIAGSGIGCSSFFFGGFLPAKRQQRTRTLQELAALDTALVFYEAPHRVAETAGEIATVMPNREACVARELTKLHEEWIRGTTAAVAEALASRPSVKGELVIVLGRPKPVSGTGDSGSLLEEVAGRERAGLSRMEAIKQVARERGLSKRELYRMLESGNVSAQE